MSLYRQFSSIVDLLGTAVNWDCPWFFWFLAAFYLVKLWELFQKQNNLYFLESFLQEYSNIPQEIQSILLKQVTEPVCQGKKGKSAWIDQRNKGPLESQDLNKWLPPSPHSKGKIIINLKYKNKCLFWETSCLSITSCVL